MVGTSILGSEVVVLLYLARGLMAPQKGRMVGYPHLTIGIRSCEVVKAAGDSDWHQSLHQLGLGEALWAIGAVRCL